MSYKSRFARHSNPGIVSDVKAGFSPQVLKYAGTMVLGGAVTKIVSTQVKNYIPIDFLKSGIGGGVVDLAVAGLLGGATRKVMPRSAGAVFFGGVVSALGEVVGPYISQGINSVTGVVTGKGTKGYGDEYEYTGINGMGDYLTVGGAQRAVPLMGMSDMGCDCDGSMSGMGDYLTVGAAGRAVPLMGYGEDVEGAEAVSM